MSELDLIRRLADGQCHSGAELARELGVSRTGIWKIVQRAKRKHGIDILALKGRGYSLSAPLDLLDPDRIRAMLPSAEARCIGQIRCFDQIDSTNAWLLHRAAQGAESGTCALAERQTAGRGRRGRPWISPFGANLYASILWHFESGPAALGPLSLAAGAAIAEALTALEIQGIQLKWPNDIHWCRRKLGGLLIELNGEPQGPSRVVIGLGLNLRMPKTEGASIDQPWVDLAEVTHGQLPERNKVAAYCLGRLGATLASFLARGPDHFLERWRRFDDYRGLPVRLSSGAGDTLGIYQGIGDQGVLLIETANGLRSFAAGEVSLRAE